MKVLIVDDSPDLLETYELILASMIPQELRFASSGEAALQIAREWRPHLVVTDLMMPGMNGLDLITRLRSDLPPPAPVTIALSGFPDLGPEAIRRGARSFEPKPVDAAELAQLVNSCLAAELPPPGREERAKERRHRTSARARAAYDALIRRVPGVEDRAKDGLAFICRYLKIAEASLCLVEERGMQAVVSTGDTERDFPAPGIRRLATDVLESGSALVLSDVKTLPVMAHGGDDEVRLLVSVPIFVGNEAVGSIVLMDPRARPFGTAELAVVELVAQQASMLLSHNQVAGLINDDGILTFETWRALVRHEGASLHGESCLALMLIETTRPSGGIPARQVMLAAPPRTALGEFGPHSLCISAAGGGVRDVEDSARWLGSRVREIYGVRSEALFTVGNLALPDGGDVAFAISRAMLAEASRKGCRMRARLVPEMSAR